MHTFSQLSSCLKSKRRKPKDTKKSATFTSPDKRTVLSSVVLTPSSSTTTGGRRASGSGHPPSLDSTNNLDTAASATAPATLPPLPVFKSYQSRVFDVEQLEFSESRDLAQLLDINWTSVKDKHDLIAFPEFEYLVSGIAYNRSSPIRNDKEERRFSFHKARSAVHFIKRAKSTPDFEAPVRV